MKVTAATITHEQLLDLYAELEAELAIIDRDDPQHRDRDAQIAALKLSNLIKTTGRALQEPHTLVWEHCRRLCADAWNARHADDPAPPDTTPR